MNWKAVRVKPETHERLKAESERTGVKMYALVERAFENSRGDLR
jgi:predicted DNA-binding protein